MRKLLFVVCSVCLSACVAMAQGKVDSQWKCDKPAPVHSLEVGDQPDHTYTISQFKCTAVKGEIAGSKEKDGAGTQFDDVKGNTSRYHGVFIDTLANGDKINVHYEGTATLEKGQVQSTSDTWTIMSGTGKLKGVKGKGTCKGKGSPDGSTTFDCTGTYTVGK
jgi:hypothetical protein